MAYKVPFVNYKRQYQQLKGEFDGVFEEVMSGGDFILRRHLEAFEKKIATFVGTKHAIGVNTGTDALYLSAHVLGFGPNDEVITVAHTFVSTVGAIVQCGATPMLVDVRDDFNIDVDGTGIQNISLDGTNMQTFGELETAVSTALQLLGTPANIRIVDGVLYVWSNTTGISSSISITVGSVDLFSSTTGFSSIETAVVGKATTTDETFDVDNGYIGVGMVNYRTGQVDMVKDVTFLADGTYHLKYAQDVRQNFAVKTTQVVLYDKQVLGNDKLSTVTIV